jgi:hypothetical protein
MPEAGYLHIVRIDQKAAPTVQMRKERHRMIELTPVTILVGIVVIAIIAVVFIFGVRSEMKPPEKTGGKE